MYKVSAEIARELSGGRQAESSIGIMSSGSDAVGHVYMPDKTKNT